MEVLTAQFVWDQLITDIKSVNKQMHYLPEHFEATADKFDWSHA